MQWPSLAATWGFTIGMEIFTYSRDPLTGVSKRFNTWSKGVDFHIINNHLSIKDCKL